MLGLVYKHVFGEPRTLYPPQILLLGKGGADTEDNRPLSHPWVMDIPGTHRAKLCRTGKVIGSLQVAEI